jgi:hypothetical protein
MKRKVNTSAPPLRRVAPRDLLAIAEETAGCAYVNRIADRQGVELEPWGGEGGR